MKEKTIEDSLTIEERFKNLEKRSLVLGKRLDFMTKKRNALLLRIRSMGKQTLALPEIDDLIRMNYEIEKSLLIDHYNFLKDGFSIELAEKDGLSEGADNHSNQQTDKQGQDETEHPTAIDTYNSRQENLITQREESMNRAEAAQAKIKDLLDSLG